MFYSHPHVVMALIVLAMVAIVFLGTRRNFGAAHLANMLVMISALAINCHNLSIAKYDENVVITLLLFIAGMTVCDTFIKVINRSKIK